MAVLKLRYIHAFKDRHGKKRHYFRRQGYHRVPLPGLPGSSEFMAAYQGALSGEIGGRRQIGRDKVIPGTIAAAIIGYLGSIEFLSTAEGTQKTRRRALERFRAEHGDKSVRSLQQHHIKAMMASMIATPNAANYLIQTVRWIMRYAIDVGWRRDDPTVGIKKIRIDSNGFHSWSEEEIEQFESFWAVGTKQRLAFDLLLLTGQRSGDVRRMTRAQIKGGAIHVRQSKTKQWVEVPIHPDLQRSLDTLPEDQLVLMLTKDGAAYTERGFGNFIVDAAQRAGLPSGCSAHGLRKAAAVRLAEAGCTNVEIMSITGHRTMQEVERYTRAARNSLLAKGAMGKLKEFRAAQDALKDET